MYLLSIKEWIVNHRCNTRKQMMLRLKNFVSLLLVYLALVPKFVAPEDGTVYEYDPESFQRQIEDMDGNFIMFYAPWCRHCTNFQPMWAELAELVNTKESKFAIAQVDCTRHAGLCHDNGITGYPTLLYYHRNSILPVEYKGTRDLPSLTLFLSEVFNTKTEESDAKKSLSSDVKFYSGMAHLTDHNIEKFVAKGQHFIMFYAPWCQACQESDAKKSLSSDVKFYSGMAHLTDHNIEKFVAKGQHFIMFYAPWCQACQRLAPVWAELGAQYAHNEYIQIGKVNCMDNEVTCATFDIKQYPYLLWIVHGRIMGVANAETLEDLKAYVEKMLLSENHDPEKFMKKKKALPVARISEETFEIFMEKDLVFVNYFAPWCAHCMQLSPLWLKLGERFQNESRVLIADVDCVRSKPICETEMINGLPTLILYKHKKIAHVEHGAQPLESLVGLVAEHLAADTDAPTAPKDEL